tara:strand:+ start:3294 stop:4127 length:834 start_codon:yes stop_codon:yes gene_type:complete
VRSALLQCAYTGDKQTMIDKHVNYVEQAASQGAQVMCFQELFYSPYFCQVQDVVHYSWSESVPDGPTTTLMQQIAAKHKIVLIVPLYEKDDAGIYYNTGVVIDSDGTFLGKYRKTHLPHLPGFWEKFYFRPGNTGYPVFETSVGRVGLYICYDRHFPEGARVLGLNGAEIVFMPSATSRGLSQHLWKIEQTSHAIANGYFVGTINRVGVEAEFGANNYYGQSYFCDPKGQFVGDVASEDADELVVRELNLDLIQDVRNTWQFYRDRRPDMYDGIVAS